MASDSSSSLYPFLSKDDFEDYKKKPEQLELINKLRENDLNKKIAKFSLSENTFNDEKPPQSAESNELRLVIIGKTGQGKSATANTILGKEKFKEDFTATSVTRESRCFTEVVDGRKISVMDTPGLQDTHQSNKNILKELARMTKLFPDGVHAFVYVMNMADPRFTAEDKNVLELIGKTFGGGFKKYCLLAFSHGDSTLKEDIDLDTYRKRQMEIVQVTRGHPTQQNVRKDQRGQNQEKTDFANLLDELSWRMLAVDNKPSTFFEKAYYRKQIVAMVDQMRTLNSPEIYTNDMFDKAKQERESLRQKGLRNGWDPLIMSKVETMIAANPKISREELNAKVNEQLQKENLDKMIALKKKEEEFEKERIAEEKRLQEQNRIYEEKRQAEEKEREKRQREDQERKKRIQKEEQERQKIREREDKKWKADQEQQRIRREKQFLLEETERKRQVAEEKEKHRREMQLQRDELEKSKQRLQEEWEKQVREEQQRRQEQDEENRKRQKEEESRRMIQIEQEREETQKRLRREEIKLEKRILKQQKEESRRQMQIKEEEQLRMQREEEEKRQFELRLTEEKEERLRERKELERLRQEQLKMEELERQKKRKQDDEERKRRIEREQEEREKAESAERERRKQAEEELNKIRIDIENKERLRKKREKQAEDIAKEHTGFFEKLYDGFASVAGTVYGWIF